MNVRVIALSAAVGFSLHVTDCRADDATNYPSQTIKIVVPFPAGGTADTFAEDRGREASPEMEPAGHHREPLGRRRQYRGRSRRKQSAGWLYAPCKPARADRDQRDALQEAFISPVGVEANH